jgi:hypothetical protein
LYNFAIADISCDTGKWGSLPTFVALQRSCLTNLAVTSVNGPNRTLVKRYVAALQLPQSGH